MSLEAAEQIADQANVGAQCPRQPHQHAKPEGITNSLKKDILHNSKATELISKRLSALSLFCKYELCFKNEPAFNDGANPGNKVSLLIPGDLYENWSRLQS